jgi:hypothetical protein
MLSVEGEPPLSQGEPPLSQGGLPSAPQEANPSNVLFYIAEDKDMPVRFVELMWDDELNGK